MLNVSEKEYDQRKNSEKVCQADVAGDDDPELDELSDISDNSDLFHVEAKPIGCRTDEDKDLSLIHI